MWKYVSNHKATYNLKAMDYKCTRFLTLDAPQLKYADQCKVPLPLLTMATTYIYRFSCLFIHHHCGRLTIAIKHPFILVMIHILYVLFTYRGVACDVITWSATSRGTHRRYEDKTNTRST